MADRNWTRRVTQVATSGVRDRVLDTVKHGAALANGIGSAVGDAAASASGLITNIEGPPVPLRQPWGSGLGQILGDHPVLPDNLRSTVRHLDRLGRIHMSTEMISFDGEAVRWEKVDEIAFGPVQDVITSHALQHEAQRLTALLPPMPGRKWLVRQALEVLIGLCRSVADRSVDDPEPEGGIAAGIPVSVTYRGSLGRRKELTPGVFAALVAASAPSFSEALMTIAAERGIPITVAPVPRSGAQALAIRKMADAMSRRLSRTDESSAEGSNDAPTIETENGQEMWDSADPYPTLEDVDMDFNYVEMTNGTKYRVLLDFEQLVQTVDQALKAGGLLTVPMGIKKPGTPATINPQHIIAVELGTY